MILPVELMRMVIRHIPEQDKSTLGRIAQCSKSLYNLATPKLYERLSEKDSMGLYRQGRQSYKQPGHPLYKYARHITAKWHSRDYRGKAEELLFEHDFKDLRSVCATKGSTMSTHNTVSLPVAPLVIIRDFDMRYTGIEGYCLLTSIYGPDPLSTIFKHMSKRAKRIVVHLKSNVRCADNLRRAVDFFNYPVRMDFVFATITSTKASPPNSRWTEAIAFPIGKDMRAWLSRSPLVRFVNLPCGLKDALNQARPATHTRDESRTTIRSSHEIQLEATADRGYENRFEAISMEEFLREGCEDIYDADEMAEFRARGYNF